MASFMDLPKEVHIMIFRYLQAITSGPRYRMRFKNLNGQTTEERNCEVFVCRGPQRYKIAPQDLDTNPLNGRRKCGSDVYQWSSDYDIRMCWELVDPGALYLASTCQYLFSIYLSPSIANNLALELPETSLDFTANDIFPKHYLNTRCMRHGLLKRLGRVKEGRRDSPLTRFILECKSMQEDTLLIWRDVLEAVNEVFGHELLVVTTCFGDRNDRWYPFVKYTAPEKTKALDALENPLVLARAKHNHLLQSMIPTTHLINTKKTHRGTGTSIPSSKCESPPLSLHMYLYQDLDLPEDILDLDRSEIIREDCSRIHQLVQAALEAFGKRSVERLYLSLGESHFDLDGDHEEENPLAILASPELRYTATLKDLTLDYRVPRAALEDLLPKLHNVQRLDLELLRFHEPFYPWSEDWRTEIARFIRDKCRTKDGKALKWGVYRNPGSTIDMSGSILPAVLTVHDYPPDEFDAIYTIDDEFANQYGSVFDKIREERSARL